MNTQLSTRISRTRRGLAVLLAVVAGSGLAGCSSSPEASTPAPVKLTDITAADGTPIKQVTLAERAVQRLGITTGTISRANAAVAGTTAEHIVVPYAAVVYDNDGSAWTYTVPSPGTYVRARITVAAIDGDVAVLTDGPADGTVVVTQGAPELLGAEAEIAGEQ